MSKEIKFIFFDVGGVIIFDFSKTNKWQEMMSDIGINKTNKKPFEDLFKKYEPEICRGRKIDTFVEVVKSELGLEFKEGYSMLDDFADRFEVNTSIHPILNELSKKYKIGLLTNMYPGMLEAIKKKGILPQVKWDVILDSSIVGFKKPQEEIYGIAENKSNTDPEKILLVENERVNINVAKKRGWQILLYNPSNPLTSNNKLRELLNIK